MTLDRATPYRASAQARPGRGDHGRDGDHATDEGPGGRPDVCRLAEMPVDCLEAWQATGYAAGYHIVTPYAQPSLPPDLAARFALLLMRSGAALAQVLARMLVGRPARWARDALLWRAEALQRRRESRQQRRIFAKLDDHLLKDIGLSRCDLYDDLAQRRGRDGADIRR